MTTQTQKLEKGIAEAFAKVAESQVQTDSEIVAALNRGFWAMFEPDQANTPRILNPPTK